MGIRQPAAEKLVRQLLELRLTRLTPLSEKFIAAMARIVIAHVDIDERKQHAEKPLSDKETNAALDKTSTKGDGNA